MIDLQHVTEQLNMIASDRGLLDAFRHQNPAFVDLCRMIVPPPPSKMPVIGFPPITEMTAIQAALFDNWPQDRRVDGFPNRYAITFEIWTLDGDDINLKKRNFQHKATAALMDRKTLSTWLKARLKVNHTKQDQYRLSDGFLADLVALADDMQEGDYVGLFAKKTKGTHFFDNQLVHIQIDGLRSSATFIVDGAALPLPMFSPFKPNSEHLHGGNVWLQSRADLCGFSVAWATQDHPA